MTGPCRSSYLALVAWALGISSLGAQSYTETERVTVIDLPVELQGGRAAKDLSVDDFVLLLDGEPQPIVAYAKVKSTDLHPYQTVVYIDSELTDSRQLRASADTLLLTLDDLLRLGKVDLVMADPEPRFLVRDSHDSEMLGNALSGDVWDDMGGDGIRALRSGFLEAIRDLDSGEELQELAVAAVREESRLVQQRLDLLLSFLATGGTPGKLRVLLLVGFRFDWDPASFYGAWTRAGEESAPSSMGSVASLESPVRQLAAAVAAYGWITLPIAPPEPESPLLPGLRIGKWRIAGPAGGRIIGVQIVRESERDPELAEAHLENGEVLLAQGKPQEARTAFKRALHHFHGDPRTAAAQARALVGLAAAERALGDDDEARTAVNLAAEVDAPLVEELGEVVTFLQDPLTPVGVLAAESSGHVVRDIDTMVTSLSDLALRSRLSIQLVGEPTGETLPVTVRTTRPGLKVASPAWVRFGPSEAVAGARLRLAMGGDLVEPTHDLDARFESDSEQEGTALLELRLETEDEDLNAQLGSETRCRLTVGTGSIEESTQRIEHQQVICLPTDSGLAVSERLSTESDYLAVLLEHLPSGSWGMTVVEREEPN
jgi:tetratricopeptide (TPR) repeat protein